jgi:cell division protease FtsH
MKTAFYGFGALVIVLLLLALFTLFQNPGRRAQSQEISFSQLLTEVDQGRVRDVLIQGPEIYGTFTDGGGFQTYAPGEPTLVQRLYAKGVSISARSPTDTMPWLVALIIAWLPFVVTLGVWIIIFRWSQTLLRTLLGIQLALEKLADREKGKDQPAPLP